MSESTVDQLLANYGRFGVRLGLETIQALLKQLGNPQTKVPIIHVAGTNGKGSVCAYLSAILTAAGYHVGCYISPHLVDWTERITLNQLAIAPEELCTLLAEVIAATTPLEASPTQFEIITAAAWLYFARQNVDIAVIEVGLGGRLDATNVCDAPLVSVITSIGRDHWQRLGNSLGEIAMEKAGILKSHRPAIIGPMPTAAQTVILERAQALHCPILTPEPAEYLSGIFTQQAWGTWRNYRFPLPLAGDVQLVNTALALATIDGLKSQGWQISDQAVTTGMAKTRWPGRLQWLAWRDQKILLDGAHNEPAAHLLRQYLDQQGLAPVTWIMGTLTSKDAPALLTALLRPQDHLHLVPIPGHDTFNPMALKTLAETICPNLPVVMTHPDLATALQATLSLNPSPQPLVLTGSLYLIGEFLREKNKLLKADTGCPERGTMC